MKTLLVTGGMGFMGSNFVRHSLDRADFAGRVVVVDNFSYAANPKNLEGLDRLYGNRLVVESADIRDMDALAGIFEQYGVDAVCHLAAQTHVDRSIDSAIAFADVNVKGTAILLETARRFAKNLLRFVFVSTDEVFGDQGLSGQSHEESPFLPNNPYSASKAGADFLVRAFYQTHGLNVSIICPSNNYGPCQHPEKLIPKAILNAAANRAIPVYGDGRNVRDWLFVGDFCKALWRVLANGKPGRRYCVGGGAPVSNRFVVEKICELVDKALGLGERSPRKMLIRFVDDRPGHDLRYATDFSRITQTLGWKPETPLESGLARTVAWYLENPDWAKAFGLV